MHVVMHFFMHVWCVNSIKYDYEYNSPCKNGRLYFHTVFIARQHTDARVTRDIDIANLSVRPSVRPSVRYVPVPYENGLTYRHSFFTIR